VISAVAGEWGKPTCQPLMQSWFVGISRERSQ